MLKMTVSVWLLLSLLTVQTVTGDSILQSQSEDTEVSKVRRIENFSQGTCGVPAIAPSTSVRVVGGVEAVPHSWPWMVSLQADGRHFCGGSLINKQWVLSAAHCAPGYKSASGVNEAMVVVGLHQRSEPDNFTVRVPVSDIIINHKFNRPGKMLTSDIMLLKLAHPVEFNDAVSPICLPSLFEALSSGKRCYTSGWGRLSTGGEVPDRLMQVMLPIIGSEVCSEPEWYGGFLDDSMVCAGYEEGERGTCNGDSGGPLVCRDGEQWVQYGVVSFGKSAGCAIANGPGVFARASAYIKWITKTIEQNSD